MKKLIVRINIKNECVENFLEYSKDIVRKSNLELDCITYKVFQEVETPYSFIIYEEYTSQIGLDIHTKSKHYNDFLINVSKLLAAEPIIEIV